jgi:hypothetical protein
MLVLTDSSIVQVCWTVEINAIVHVGSIVIMLGSHRLVRFETHMAVTKIRFLGLQSSDKFE